MNNLSGSPVTDRWPRLVHLDETDYLVHQVAFANVTPAGISFTCLRADGATMYPGPSFVWGRREPRDVSRVLNEHGIRALDEVRFVAAVHWGAEPSGIVARMWNQLPADVLRQWEAQS